MNSPTRTPLRIIASTYVPLRPEVGVVTLAAVRRTRWHLTRGGRAVIAVYGMSSWEAGAPEQIGRILAESGVRELYVQASAPANVVDAFTRAIGEAAAAYDRLVPQ